MKAMVVTRDNTVGGTLDGQIAAEVFDDDEMRRVGQSHCDRSATASVTQFLLWWRLEPCIIPSAYVHDAYYLPYAGRRGIVV